MKTNSATKNKVFTHEGAVGQNPSVLTELRRTVMNCLLFEDTFYEKGTDIAARIQELSTKVTPSQLHQLAVEAREKFYLRHVPLFLTRQLARRDGALTADALDRVIQRADEPGEFLSLYWKDNGGKKTLSAGVKRGLGKAFSKFNPYQYAKYNRDADVKLRDVMFLTHSKPLAGNQEETFKQIAENTLVSPDTWEVQLSAGADKKETFTRLLKEEKLGGLATLRNLRNMQEAGVSEKLIRERLENGPFKKILPFQFVAAARYAPTLENSIEKAMFKGIEELPRLSGKTGLLIDVSGSMDGMMSGKSKMRRLDAAAALAIYLRETVEGVEVATFSDDAHILPPRRGFALRDAIANTSHGGTYLQKSLVTLAQKPAWAKLDRLIIITDEQSHDGIMPGWTDHNYVVNVAPYQNGVSYGNGYTHIDGFSERIIDYILAVESEE